MLLTIEEEFNVDPRIRCPEIYGQAERITGGFVKDAERKNGE